MNSVNYLCVMDKLLLIIPNFWRSKSKPHLRESDINAILHFSRFSIFPLRKQKYPQKSCLFRARGLFLIMLGRCSLFFRTRNLFSNVIICQQTARLLEPRWCDCVSAAE